MSKKKKMLHEGTKIRWSRIANIVDDQEARRRSYQLNEATRKFPGNEIEEDMEMNPDGGYHYLDEEDEELADVGGTEDFGGAGGGMDDEYDMGMDDMGMDDMSMGAGAGDETLAADLITAVSDAIASVLGTEAEVSAEPDMGDDMGMDYDVDDMGAEDDMGMDDMEMGAEDDLDDDELMEELENSINPNGGKVDNSHSDHKLSKEKSHLKNSINESRIDQIAESVVRKLARHMRKRR